MDLPSEMTAADWILYGIQCPLLADQLAIKEGAVPNYQYITPVVYGKD